MRNSCLLLFVLLASLSGYAQDFAVTHRGDTLNGEIRILNFGSDRKIQINSKDKKKTILPITQVKNLTIDSELYRPVKGPQGYAFMKIRKDGYLSLYAFQLPNQTTFDGMLIGKKDGTFLEVPNLGFKKAMTNFLSECESTATKIENGTLTKKDIEAIIDDFNACIDARSRTQQVAAVQPEIKAPVETPHSAANSTAWQTLVDKVQALPDFEGKSDVEDMLAEIKNKVSRSERIPNFLLEGVKSSLKDKGVDEELKAALASIK